jgi:A/G-specific adenine glycosylase
VDVTPVIDWYHANKRDLPWRAPDASPWSILVSEIMLQQTPVSRVLPVWTAWMERWPTPHHLAEATLGEVLQNWNRMGYPRRARNLHNCAITIVRDFDGEVPTSLDDLLGLPGVGDYTARAVACFAFGDPHPVVDTNVKRVIARALHGDAAAGHWSTKEGLTLVDESIDRPVSDEAYCHSQQALMELGALVCTAKNPTCEECPLTTHCQWKLAGYPVDQSVLPRSQARYEGSDRQVRGLILALLRDEPTTHGLDRLEQLWPKTTQLRKAVASLVTDGLIQETDSPDGPIYGLSWREPYPGE